MLNLFLNRKSVLACSADCPADNHARQLAQFLYETLQHIKTMLKPVSNRKSLLACFADCPADNQARQLALFLYETLSLMLKKIYLLFMAPH
jgi:hypothetical protein